MNILIRSDASHQIGSGHITRCLSLALALRERGHHVVFASASLPGNSIPAILDSGFIVIEPTAITEHYDVAVVDHYGLDHIAESKLRTHAQKIVVIDDFGKRKHDADLMIDPSISSLSMTRGEANPGTPFFYGADWLLLRSEFKSLHSSVKPRTQFKNVLIFFGGTDPADQIIRYTHALLKQDPWFIENKIQFHLLASKQHPKIEEIKKTRLASNVSLHISPNIAELMSKMDFYLGSSGVVTGERFCLGLTGLVISIVDNQEDIAQTSHDLNLHQYLGKVENISPAQGLESLKKELQKPSEWSARSKTCLALVDGLGAERLAREIEKMIIAKIALGTVQFGMQYGITNSNPPPSDEELEKILKLASQSGIHELDTANTYGDAQIRIGKILKKTGLALGVFGKIKLDETTSVQKECEKALLELQQSRLGGMYFHRYEDLTDPRTVQEMKELKQEGKFSDLGVSVYTTEEIEACINHKEISVIQVPYNLLDQSDRKIVAMKRARAAGKKIYVRSIYLQGLICSNPETILEEFRELQSEIRSIHELAAKANQTPAGLCLAYVLSLPYIDRVVMGVASFEELSQNLSSIIPVPAVIREKLSLFGKKPLRSTDPRTWGKPK